MTNLSDKIFSIKKQSHHKVICILGLKFKFSRKISMKEFEDVKQKTEDIKKLFNEKIQKLEQKQTLLEQKFKSEINRSNYIHNKRFEQFMLVYKWLRHTNLMLNRLIEDVNAEDLKSSQIKYLFQNIHKNIYDPNIENPRTFDEKILWLCKHYFPDNPLIGIITDKYRFKQYIKEKLGDGYTIPLLGKWDNAQDVDFDALPDSFVLKSNWGGDDAQVMLVEDKSKLNIDETKNKLAEWIAPSGSPYYYAFNTIFKNIKPCIIAEEFIKTNDDWMLNDYKFFCFNGKFRMGYVNIRRRDGGKICYFDADWNFLPITYSGFSGGEEYFPEKPACFEKLVEIAEKLAADFPFARIDFYIPENRIYLGEITFTPGGGMGHIEPVEWDYKMGEILDISYLMEKKHD